MASNSTSYADGYGAAASNAPSQAEPDYLKQTPNNPTYMGALNNMVRALMAGYQKAQNRPEAAPGAAPGTAMPITPPTQQWPSAGTAGVPYTGGGPLGTGIPPDPMATALFTPPPASPYGVGSTNAVY